MDHIHPIHDDALPNDFYKNQDANKASFLTVDDFIHQCWRFSKDRLAMQTWLEGIRLGFYLANIVKVELTVNEVFILTTFKKKYTHEFEELKVYNEIAVLNNRQERLKKELEEGLIKEIMKHLQHEKPEISTIILKFLQHD